MSKAQRDKGARFEREIASLLGVRRRLRADYSESAPDIETEHFIVECKRRSKIAIGRWMDQVRGYAERDEAGRIPVVFCREDGGPVLAILYAEDLLALVNKEGD
jgi:Holliday junction resolvase